MFQFDGGLIVQMNSSWCVRVNRDELFELQVDGTDGSAVAGLRECKIQSAVTTPKSVWNPDLADPIEHRDSWSDVPATEPPENGFKLQWEALPAPRRARRAVPVGLRRGRARRAALRARRAVLARAALGRRPGADAVSLTLPRADGTLEPYEPTRREPLPVHRRGTRRTRVAYAAAHVVADPLAGGDPTGPAQLDWETTLHFRRHLWAHGLRVAEAMDTAQRGMGLDWEATKELIRRSAAEAKAVGGKLACGAGTDQLDRPGDARRRPPRVRRAARVRRGRGLAGDPDGQPRAGRRGHERRRLQGGLRRAARAGAHAGDPALARRHVRSRARRILGNDRSRGRFGHRARDHRGAPGQGRRHQGLAAGGVLRGRAARAPAGGRAHVHRRRLQLPGADRGADSDALLGIFDAIAPAAAAALHALDDGDTGRYDALLAPTVPLSAATSSRRRRRTTRPASSSWPTSTATSSTSGWSEGWRAAATCSTSPSCSCSPTRPACCADPERASARMRQVLALAGI